MAVNKQTETPMVCGIRPEADEIVVKFVHEKSTKNTERFTEVLDEGKTPVVGTFYVRKGEMLRLGNPLALTVTIRRSV